MLLGAIVTSAHADDNVLVMGYPERDKIPMIADVPSHEGIFKDLYTAAAARLGMKLEIVRKPKKRIYAEMAEGKIDFYPAAAYAADRTEFMFWFPNGLQTQEMCVTGKAVPLITDLAKAPAMRVGQEIGGSKADLPKTHPQLRIVELGTKIDFEMLMQLITAGRSDLMFADKEVIEYHKAQKNIKDFADLGLKIHPDCLEAPGSADVGFSRKSSKFSEQPNPAFKSDKPRSPENQPTMVKPDSIAGKLAAVLAEMKKSGESKRIYDKGMERKF